MKRVKTMETGVMASELTDVHRRPADGRSAFEVAVDREASR